MGIDSLIMDSGYLQRGAASHAFESIHLFQFNLRFLAISQLLLIAICELFEPLSLHTHRTK